MGKLKMEKFESYLNQENIINLFAICTILLSTFLIGYTVFLQNTNGDFEAYMSGAKAFSLGEDPYTSSRGKLADSNTDFVYFPITLPVFVLLLKITEIISLQATQYLLFTAITGLSGYLIYSSLEENNLYYLTSIFLGGFGALYWNFMTGNIAIISLLIASLLIYGYRSGRESLCISLAGALSTIKIFHVAPLGLYLFRPGKLAKKLKYLSIGFGTYFCLILTNFLIFPDLTDSYLATQFSDKSSLAFEAWAQEGIKVGSAGSVGFMIGDIVELFSTNQELIIALFLVWVGLVSLSLYSYMVRNKNFLRRISFGIISFLLILPSELNPYAMDMALPSVYILSKDFGIREKIFVLASVVILPGLGIIGMGKILPLPEGVIYSLMTFVFNYSSKLSLVLFWTIIVYKNPVKIPNLEELKGLIVEQKDA